MLPQRKLYTDKLTKKKGKRKKRNTHEKKKKEKKAGWPVSFPTVAKQTSLTDERESRRLCRSKTVVLPEGTARQRKTKRDERTNSAFDRSFLFAAFGFTRSSTASPTTISTLIAFTLLCNSYCYPLRSALTLTRWAGKPKSSARFSIWFSIM